MNLNHKTLALLIVLAGVLLAGGYMLGVNQAGGESPSSSGPADASAGRGAGPLGTGAQMPSDHPPLEGQAAQSAVSARQPSPASRPFTHFRVGNRNVKGLFLDGDTAWIGTSGGVIRYDARTDSHKVFDNRVDGILSNGVFHVSKLGDEIVAGTYGGGLSVYSPDTGRWRNYNIPDGLADQFVYEVMKAGNGDVWIATWSGVNRIIGGELDDSSKWRSFTVESTDGGLPNPWVYALDEGPDGTMWFATEEGLARYKDGVWKNWQHDDGLGADYEVVRDAIQFTNDPGRQSLHHAQQKSAQGIQDIDVAYNPNYIISLEVDGSGAVWCGTWGAGLARFDGEQWRNFTTADGLPSNHIFMLYLDPEGRLWAGTSQGLARLEEDGKTFAVMTTADGLFANNVFSMARADDGTLWVGSFGGVARIPGGG